MKPALYKGVERVKGGKAGEGKRLFRGTLRRNSWTLCLVLGLEEFSAARRPLAHLLIEESLLHVIHLALLLSLDRTGLVRGAGPSEEEAVERKGAWTCRCQCQAGQA